MEALPEASIKEEIDSDGGTSSSSSDELSSLDELSSSDEPTSDEDSAEDLPLRRTTGLGGKTKPFQRIYEEDPELEKMLRDMNLLRCKTCRKKFTTSLNLASHWLVDHGKGCPSITCCAVRFWGRKEMYDHMRYHRNRDAFKCLECGKICLCDRTLQRHKRAMHSAPQRLTFKCETCGKAFKAESLLNMHVKNHIDPKERRFKCSKCAKSESFYPPLSLPLSNTVAPFQRSTTRVP